MDNSIWILELIRDRDCRTDAERDAMNRAIDVLNAIDNIKAEIDNIYCGQYCENPMTADEVRETALEIIDKYISRKRG